MSRIIPVTGPESRRTTQAAQINAGELHTTSDQLRLFLNNAIVAPRWHGSVADETAMKALANRYSVNTISAAAADNSINDSASGFPNWAPGATITIGGFDNDANNQVGLTIVSRTASKIVLSGGTALVDDAASGEIVTITKDGTAGCWPGDKCKRTDIGTIWECITNNGGALADWVEVTTDRIGTIRMWSGSLAALPTGYLLCDGTSGTPDLSDKFIQGKASGTNIGDTGGAVNHQHGVSGLTAASASAGTPSGTVSQPTFTGNPVAAASTNATPDLVTADILSTGVSPVTTATGTVSQPTFTGNALAGHTHTLSGSNTDNADGRPPFYVLAFIKRVS